MRLNRFNALPVALVPALVLVAGCGGHVSALAGLGLLATRPQVQASAKHIDTNGTTQFTATLADGSTAEPEAIEWKLSGGDPSAGTGSISRTGLYSPPSYLTQDAVTVAVSAALRDRPAPATPVEPALLTVTPGFLQPLTPGNLALAPGASVTISGSMTEVGGSGRIQFALASDTAGTPTEAGSLSEPRCVLGSVASANPAYTVCRVTYTAPATVSANNSVYIVGTTIGPAAAALGAPTRSWTRILLNTAGITSNPATHQAHLPVPVQLGSSSGNNSDYDSARGQLSDCCGGTLGALLQDASGTQYVLSDNHVLARSDQSIPGETIIQPGLIDNGCSPYGFGPGTTPVATLSGYPALSLPGTNVDAAIARVTAGTVDARGSILELGARLADGTLAAAPPGVSSSGGKGETASLGLTVAKSGRTTGLTCSAVSAVAVDVKVDYFTDCAETSHSFTKTFTNQIAIAGTNFTDAGDSGALVVNAANAEPVGLFFAGGTDANGVEQAIASPIGDVLTSLNSQVPGPAGPTTYSVVGGADHPVSCLSYGNAPQADVMATASLPLAERERVDGVMPLAQLLVNPATGVSHVAPAISKDHPGEGAIALTVEPEIAGISPSRSAIPDSVAGVPTVVMPGAAVTAATPETAPGAKPASVDRAMLVKQRNSVSLLKSNAAIFGVGVGQSLDNPAEAAIVLFVDRKEISGKLPLTLEGVRVRTIYMDRLHVTRSHGTPGQGSGICPGAHAPRTEGEPFLIEDRLSLTE